MVQEENESSVRIVVSKPDSDGKGDDRTVRLPNLTLPVQSI